MRDYLALVGDSVDNVPGVPSVGPKTAVQLLQQFGDLDALYAGLEKVEKKGVRQKLTDHREAAMLSRKLVTLRDDLQLDPDPNELALPAPDLPRLRALFTELGFTRCSRSSRRCQRWPLRRATAGGRRRRAGAGQRANRSVAAKAAPGAAQLELGVQPSEPARAARSSATRPQLAELASALGAAQSFALLSLMEGRIRSRGS